SCSLIDWTVPPTRTPCSADRLPRTWRPPVPRGHPNNADSTGASPRARILSKSPCQAPDGGTVWNGRYRAKLGRRKPGRITQRGRLAMCLGLCLALAVMFVPLSASGQTSGRRAQPRSVKTSSDAARRKLDKNLQQAHDPHAKGEVAVFASVVGSPRGALRQLRNGRATAGGKASLVVGSIPTQRLLKLASDL